MYDLNLLQVARFISNYDNAEVASATEEVEPMKWSADLVYDGQLIAHACNTTTPQMDVDVKYMSAKGQAILKELAGEFEDTVEDFVELTVECTQLG